jgi:RimJ/RimL family protein N-acetyltransferase
MNLPPPRIPETPINLIPLPLKPAPVTLKGNLVTLRPLDIEKDLDPLYAVSNGSAIQIGERYYPEYDANELIWKLFRYGPFPTKASFHEYLVFHQEPNNQTMFTIRDTETDRHIGMCGILYNSPEHLKCELGRGWLSPIAQGTGAAQEGVFMLMKHLFELGYRRIETRCNVLNIRSYNTLIKSGATLEMIQEKYAIFKGESIDSAFFRVLDCDWERLKAKFDPKL